MASYDVASNICQALSRGPPLRVAGDGGVRSHQRDGRQRHSAARVLGKAVQVEPLKPVLELKRAWTKALDHVM
jgi:hypothetical protein